MPVLCNACGTRWARSANSDRVPAPSQSGGGAEDERSAPDTVLRAARCSTPKPSPGAAQQRPGSRSRSASPAVSALSGLGFGASPLAALAARVASPSPLKPVALPPLRPAIASVVGSSDAAAVQQRPAAASHHTGADAGSSASRSASRASLVTASAEEAVMSAAAAMLRESAAAVSGSSVEARLAAERMATLEPQARSRVIAAGVRASISAPMAAPSASASSFAAAFLHHGMREELRGGAPVPPEFAGGWPTIDGRTLSASFLDSASKQQAKQDRIIRVPLSRHTSAPAAADSTEAAAAESVRMAALSEPMPIAADHRAAAAAAQSGEADVYRPPTPAQASMSASPRVVTPDTATAPDAASTDAPGDTPANDKMLPMPLPAVTAPAPAELLQLLGRSQSPGLPSPIPLKDPEALWTAAAEYVAEARAQGRLPPEPPMPPRTPPLFGLQPLEPLGLPLGLGQPPRKRKAPAPISKPPAARPRVPAQSAGRQPGDFLVAAGLVPLPAVRRPAARDPRPQQPTLGLQQQQQHVQQQLQQQQQQHRVLQQPPAAGHRSMGPLGLFLQQAAAAQPAGQGARKLAAAGASQEQGAQINNVSQQQSQRLRPSPASSAATVTASEPEAGEGSDWSGAESTPPAAATLQRRKKRKKLFTGGRRPPPPPLRPVLDGVRAAAVSTVEDEECVPLDMGGDVKYGSISKLYRQLPTVSAASKP